MEERDAVALGEFRIDEISGTRLKGWFRSLAKKDVANGSPYFVREFLTDAWVSSGQQAYGLASRIARDTVEEVVQSVTFHTPHAEETVFEIEVSDPETLKGLKPVSWKSFVLG